jgi:protein-tyrosine phosphatase
MRQIRGASLWIGHSGDVRDTRLVLATDILAVVDLAYEEPPATLSRDLVSVRIPLIDGTGNARWRLRAAIETVAGLVAAEVPTLVGCGAGLSRSPCVAGMALARVRGWTAEEGLALVLEGGRSDVSPGFWSELRAAMAGSL